MIENDADQTAAAIATDETDTDRASHPSNAHQPAGREGDGQEYLDRSKLDFDPDDGLLAGTVIDGTTEIPGPHPGMSAQEDEPRSAAN